MVDCDPGNSGCSGGNPARAIEFIKYSTGMWYEGEVPYSGIYNGCKWKYPSRDLGFPKLNTD